MRTNSYILIMSNAMTSADLAADLLAGLLVVVIPLTGPIERRVYRSNPRTALKLLAYGVNTALLWALTSAAVGIVGWRRLLERPAAGTDWLWEPAIVGPALGLGVAAYMVVALLPMAQSLRGPRRRLAYAAAYRRSFSDLPGMLPDTGLERMGWVILSLTAGICEEILFRGFLIRFLHDLAPALPLAAALVASSLIFGLAHAYQGPKGVLGTGLGGVVFGLLFLLTGSLIPGMILHALVDMQIAYVLRPGSAAGVPAAQAA